MVHFLNWNTLSFYNNVFDGFESYEKRQLSCYQINMKIWFQALKKHFRFTAIFRISYEENLINFNNTAKKKGSKILTLAILK